MSVSFPVVFSVTDDVSRGVTERPFSGGSGGGPVTIVYDSFTEASNTSLALHTPDTDLTGSAWTISGSAFTVIGASDYLSPPTGGGSFATVSPSGYDSYLSEVSFQFTGDVGGIQLRFIDSNNRWNCFWSGTTFAIQEIDGGVATNRDSETAPSPQAGDSWWFSATDGELSAGRNRAAASLTYSSTLHNTSDVAGLTSVASASGYDDFYLMGNTVDPNDLP